MYRNYENPWELEESLNDFLESHPKEEWDEYDYETYYELKDRINFAWQDQEYDKMNRDYADEMWMWENCYNTDMDWDEDVQIMYEESEIMREYGEI